MKILVDNKIEELEIIDPKTGCNYEQDLIGNADGFDGFDSYDQELHTMTGESFGWWSTYIDVEQDLQNRIYDLRNRLDDTDDFDRDAIGAGDGDYETMQSNLSDVVEKWESVTDA